MLLEKFLSVKILERASGRRIRTVQPHTVCSLCAYTKCLLVFLRRLAHDGSFTGDKPGCGSPGLEVRGRVLDVALACPCRSVVLVEAAGPRHAFRPCARIQVQTHRLGKRNHNFLVAEVVSLRRCLHLLQSYLLHRIGSERSLVCLVGGCPQRSPQCDRIAVKRREAKDRKSTRLNSSHLGISYAVF